MESLFEKQTAQNFIERINKLTPASKAQWGKMDVAQMAKHCQPSFKIASGDLKIKVNPLIRFLFGNRARKQILDDPQFKKNLPTFAEAKVVDQHVLEEEKKKLITLIEKHQAGGSEKIIKEPHPFFGAMTLEEWNALLVKHLDHHLRQFGA
jgi:hypothetical protein